MAENDKPRRPTTGPEQRQRQGIRIPMSSLAIAMAEPASDEKNKTGGKDGKSKTITHERVKSILIEKSRMLSDARGIMELNPDMKLAKEILVAQTLSPKDLATRPLNLQCDKAVYKKPLKPEVMPKILSYFRTTFQLEGNLGKICGDSLFDQGAWIYLFIPPSKIDELTEVKKFATLESVNEFAQKTLNKGTNLLDKLDINTKEKMKGLGVTEFSTNINILRQYQFEEKLQADTLNDLSSVALESFIPAFSQMTKRKLKENPTVTLKRMKEGEKATSNAIVLPVAVDACMPIPDPVDPSKHKAYIFVVDESGHITSSAKDANFVADLERRLKDAMDDLNGDGPKNENFEVIKDTLGTITSGKDAKAFNPSEFIDLYYETITAPIKEALKKNNINPSTIKIEDYEGMYRLILSRFLSGSKSRLLIVPADYVTYLAFDYNSAGQGVSLVEKTRFYSSLRTILQLVDMMSSVVNGIPSTEVTITLDEADNDPEGTVEALLHELSRLTTSAFPIGSNDPSEIISGIQKACYRLKIDGGTKFPKTNIERNDVQRNRPRIDTDLHDQLKRKLFGGLGVHAEVIDRTLEGETATSLILNDLLSTKRALERQIPFCRGIEDIIRTAAYFSPELQEIIKEQVGDDYDEFEDFIWSLRLILPSADLGRIEQQAQAFNEVTEFYTKAIDAYLTDDMLRGMLGSTEITKDILADFKNIFVAEFQRRWLRDNNILPMFDDIIKKTEDGDKSFADSLKEHYGAVFENFAPIIKAVLKDAAKIDAAYRKAKPEGSDDGGGYGGGLGSPPSAFGVEDPDETDAAMADDGTLGGETPPDDGIPPTDEPPVDDGTTPPPEEAPPGDTPPEEPAAAPGDDLPPSPAG